MRFLHAKDVQVIMKVKHEQKKESFYHILEKCFSRIEKAALKDLNFMMFQVPEFILGKPIYNLNECIHFLVHHLQTKGYYVQYFFPNILFIHWLPPKKEYLTYQHNADTEQPQGPDANKQSKAQKGFIKSITEFKPSGKFVLNLN